MRTTLAILLLVFLAGTVSGCLYANFKTPLDMDLDQTQLGPDTGEASVHSILGLVAWGDAGVAAAARDGGLTTLNHMDVEILNIFFGIYSRETTIVYGE